MAFRRLMSGVLLVQLACTTVISADARWVEGLYRNPALGYSIKVPHGLKGLTGDQAGPERGLRILLPSGGTILVYGEPNSLEWKSPEEGVLDALTNQHCVGHQPEIKQTRVGKLGGARGSLLCGESVTTVILVFRPGGGPIYWLQLKTARAHESEDNATLETIAASFTLIRWE